MTSIFNNLIILPIYLCSVSAIGQSISVTEPHSYDCIFQSSEHKLNFIADPQNQTKIEFQGYKIRVQNDTTCPALHLKDLATNIEVTSNSGNVNEYLSLILKQENEHAVLHCSISTSTK